MKCTRIFSLLIILGLAAPFGCQTETVPPLREVTYASRLSDEPVLVQVIQTPGIPVEAARAAVLQATKKRGWKVESLDNGDVRTSLVHRISDATLTFTFSDGKVEVYSVSYKIDKNTQARIEREEPEGWIRNIHKDVLALLGLLPTA